MKPEDLHIDMECLEVAIALRYGAMMGTDRYNRYVKIILDHPKEFPWHHKYYSLPQEVHQAYWDEICGGHNPFIAPLFDENEVPKGDGLLSEMTKAAERPTLDLRQAMIGLCDAMDRAEKRRIEELEKRRVTFNKHYNKHGLKWQEGY